jgi:AcrR family transcriptional regulator
VSPAELVDAGKRAQTKATNRAAILRAAREVFAELGYGAAGVRDIVRRTDLAAGTFYNYFPDKEAVFRALVDEFAEEVRGPVARARARATSPEAFVGDAYLEFFSYVAREREMFRLIRRNADTIPVITEDPAMGALMIDLAADLEAAIARGDWPPFDVAFMAAAMAGTALELADQMLARDPVDPQATATFATELFLGGLDRLGREPR